MSHAPHFGISGLVKLGHEILYMVCTIHGEGSFYWGALSALCLPSN